MGGARNHSPRTNTCIFQACPRNNSTGVGDLTLCFVTKNVWKRASYIIVRQGAVGGGSHFFVVTKDLQPMDFPPTFQMSPSPFCFHSLCTNGRIRTTTRICSEQLRAPFLQKYAKIFSSRLPPARPGKSEAGSCFCGKTKTLRNNCEKF